MPWLVMLMFSLRFSSSRATKPAKDATPLSEIKPPHSSSLTSFVIFGKIGNIWNFCPTTERGGGEVSQSHHHRTVLQTTCGWMKVDDRRI